MDYIVAVDQGTSSTKAMLVAADGRVARTVTVPIGQHHPQPGWVEQDATEILDSVVSALVEIGTDLDGTIAAVGLSTQRESAVIWDRKTAQPLGPVIGWQDRRTGPMVAELIGAGHGPEITAKTGLPIDPMFSAPKLRWLLDHTEVGPNTAAGTVDNWLVFALTGNHHIEYGNASRTLLLNLDTAGWDDDAAALFGVDTDLLGQLQPSNAVTGRIVGIAGYESVPITSVLGDSHAALYGHGVRESGRVKATYGTGSSVLGLVGADVAASNGLARTIAWHDGTIRYALEGNILSTGATIAWLARLLGITPSEVFERVAGVDIEAAMRERRIDVVPAFAGLGAPWWDQDAQGLITGLTLGDQPADLGFAAVESIALQIEDVLTAADAASGSRITEVMADGGPSRNDDLLQLQAEISQRTITRTSVPELSALGTAHLAGLTVGMWDEATIAGFDRDQISFIPRLGAELADRRRQRWNQAVQRSRWNASATNPASASSPASASNPASASS